MLDNTALNYIHEGILCIDKGRIAFANPFMEELTGYTSSEVLQGLTVLFNCDEAERKFWQLVQEAKQEEKFEVRLQLF